MPATPTTLHGLVNIFLELLRLVVPILVGLALIIFLWGLIKFISRVGGDEKAVSEGRSLMIWGLIALFIMVSIWGILALAYRDIGFTRPFGLPLLPPYRTGN